MSFTNISTYLETIKLDKKLENNNFSLSRHQKHYLHQSPPKKKYPHYIFPQIALSPSNLTQTKIHPPIRAPNKTHYPKTVATNTFYYLVPSSRLSLKGDDESWLVALVLVQKLNFTYSRTAICLFWRTQLYFIESKDWDGEVSRWWGEGFGWIGGLLLTKLLLGLGWRWTPGRRSSAMSSYLMGRYLWMRMRISASDMPRLAFAPMILRDVPPYTYYAPALQPQAEPALAASFVHESSRQTTNSHNHQDTIRNNQWGIRSIDRNW